MSHDLAENIQSSGFKPDVLIGISRGGLPIVRTLSDFLDISTVFIIRVKYYEDIEKRQDKPMIMQDISTDTVANKKILLVDDIADTGNSMLFARDLMINKKVSEVKTATLHFKPWSKIKPDYYIEESQKWIVYPWEIYETIRKILSRAGLNQDEKIQELNKTGIPREIIEKFSR
jgi:hypoxanthine phosphoribosyltransferase